MKRALAITLLLFGTARADAPHARHLPSETELGLPPDHVMLGDEPQPGEEPVEHQRTEHVPHVHHHRLNLGATGAVGGAFASGQSFAGGGGGVFLEVPLVRRQLELELSVQARASEGGAELAQELLFKVPIHVNHWFAPFVGLGPGFTEYWVAGEDPTAARRRGWGVGGALSVGAHLWITNRVGLVTGIGYGLLYRWLTDDATGATRGSLVSELGTELGVIVGL
jgi:hypothetical protein